MPYNFVADSKPNDRTDLTVAKTNHDWCLVDVRMWSFIFEF